jgi:hypothetical protein
VPGFTTNTAATVQQGTSSPLSTLGVYAADVKSWAKGVIADPVNRVTGTFTYEHDDLNIGSLAYPLGLDFKRLYDSGGYLQKELAPVV